MTKQTNNYIMTLNSFLQSSGQSAELQSIVLSMANACKTIQKGIISCGVGKMGDANASGDEQMELDVLANTLLEEELKRNNNIYAYASEEEENSVTLNENGNYCVAFDPLDGSSLIDTNLAIGTIFSVYKSHSFIGQQGKNQVCAGYAVYGPRLTFVFTFGTGIFAFLLTENESCLLFEKHTISEEAKTFSPGNLRASQEDEKYFQLVNDWILEQKTLRYSGGMVPDINQIFCKGSGIFTYPRYSKYPNGKLRLLYECAPFAFLAEACGALALDQNGEDIVNLKITELHQRSTIFIGSKNEVIRAVKTLK